MLKLLYSVCYNRLRDVIDANPNLTNFTVLILLMRHQHQDWSRLEYKHNHNVASCTVLL